MADPKGNSTDPWRGIYNDYFGTDNSATTL